MKPLPWHLEDWWLTNWPIIALSVAVLSMLAGAVVHIRRGVNRRTFKWYCAYCCAVGGFVLAVLVWSGHWPSDKALIVFVALIVGESLVAFGFRRWDPPDDPPDDPPAEPLAVSPPMPTPPESSPPSAHEVRAYDERSDR